MPTGRKAASTAGEQLANKRSTQPQRMVAGSDLAQTPKKSKKAKKKSKKK